MSWWRGLGRRRAICWRRKDVGRESAIAEAHEDRTHPRRLRVQLDKCCDQADPVNITLYHQYTPLPLKPLMAPPTLPCVTSRHHNGFTSKPPIRRVLLRESSLRIHARFLSRSAKEEMQCSIIPCSSSKWGKERKTSCYITC